LRQAKKEKSPVVIGDERMFQGNRQACEEEKKKKVFASELIRDLTGSGKKQEGKEAR